MLYGRPCAFAYARAHSIWHNEDKHGSFAGRDASEVRTRRGAPALAVVGQQHRHDLSPTLLLGFAVARMSIAQKLGEWSFQPFSRCGTILRMKVLQHGKRGKW